MWPRLSQKALEERFLDLLWYIAARKFMNSDHPAAVELRRTIEEEETRVLAELFKGWVSCR